MALTRCGECGREVSDKAPTCPQCGAPVAASQRGPSALFVAAGGSPMPVLAHTGPSQEITFYTDQNGIRITNARAIIGNRTYSMANLTTVTVAMTVPPKGGAIAIIVVGALLLIGGIANGSGGAILAGLIAIGIGALWIKSLVTQYHVVVGGAGGENNALTSPNRAYIQSVAQALNEAIVKRG